MTIKKLFPLFVFFAFFTPSASAQNAAGESFSENEITKKNLVAFEFQVYPTGLIPGIKYERYISSVHGLHLRLAYNRIRHGDAGVHEDERGSGYGFTLGYRRYLSSFYKNVWFVGARNDVWFSSVDWKDAIGKPDEMVGNSKITVVQPTLEGGYRFFLKKGTWFLEPSLAFGFEFNVKTKGEKVGEGPILLAGINFGKLF